MSGRPGKPRNQRVLVQYSSEEFEVLRQKYARSTSRTFSHYVRKVSLEDPVEVTVRNESFDAFVEEVIALRKTMMEVFSKGNWGVADRERLLQLHHEIKLQIDKIAELCMPH